MSLTVENNRQISADLFAGDANTGRVHVATMTFTYRIGKRMNLSLEIINEEAAAAAGEEVALQVQEFICEAFARAAEAGLPVTAPGSE